MEKKDSIFYINFIFENSYNSFKEKKYVLNEFFNVISIIYNKFSRTNIVGVIRNINNSNSLAINHIFKDKRMEKKRCKKNAMYV
jgi:hypothetical protein